MTQTNSELHEQLEQQYIQVRMEYCNAMMVVLDRAKILVSDRPINEGMREAIIDSTGMKIKPVEALDDFDERFEDYRGQTQDEYINFVLSILEGILEPARRIIIAAANKELRSLTPGVSGSARQDFQHTIHEGPESRIIEVVKQLPKDGRCIQVFNQAKEAFRDAATFLIEADNLAQPEDLNQRPRL